MVFLVVFLQEPVAFFQGTLGEVGAFDNADIGRREANGGGGHVGNLGVGKGCRRVVGSLGVLVRFQNWAFWFI